MKTLKIILALLCLAATRSPKHAEQLAVAGALMTPDAATPAPGYRWKISWSHPGTSFAGVSFNLWGDTDPLKVRAHFLTNVPVTARSAVWVTASPQFYFTVSTLIP